MIFYFIMTYKGIEIPKCAHKKLTIIIMMMIIKIKTVNSSHASANLTGFMDSLWTPSQRVDSLNYIYRLPSGSLGLPGLSTV